MRIKCLTTFLDGVDRFEKDDQRTVVDERGARFVAAGWAADLDGRVAKGESSAVETTLYIKSDVIGTGDNHG